MTKLLEKAFEEASKLSEEEQEALAKMLLAEILSETRWTKALEASRPKLEKLADEALAEFEQGKTRPIERDL